MSWEAWYTLAVVVATIVVLARGLLPPAGAMVGAMVAVLVPGVVTPSEALSGFSNPAPATIAALYVLSRAVEQTGTLTPLVERILGEGGRTSRTVAKVAAPTMVLSGFLNNTPIVAMLIPQVEAWCRTVGRSASLYLMPLSFAAIMGGAITLMGTATNIVSSGLLESIGEPPLGFFEISWVGLPIALVSLPVLIVLSPRLLKARLTPRSAAEEGYREFVVDMTVLPGSGIDGVSVEEAGLRRLAGVFLISIERGGDELIAPVGPTTVLLGGDRLRFIGRAGDVVDLDAMPGLASAATAHVLELDPGPVSYFEAVIGADSPLVGTTVRRSDFRGRYQAAIVAIHRAGRRVNAKIGDIELRVGDTLLLLADRGFKGRWGDQRDFLLISPLRAARTPRSPRATIVVLVAAGIVITAATGLLPLVAAALLGALILVASRTITAGDALRAVDIDVIVTIAAAFGLAAAIETSGLGMTVAHGVIRAAEPLGDVAILGAVVLLTLVLKEIITQKAAVLLMMPIAFSVAAEAGSNVRAHALAVAVAGALAYLTPIGAPTNTMVYGPGGYRFGDYLRLGVPLTVVAFVGILVFVPLHWPL